MFGRRRQRSIAAILLLGLLLLVSGQAWAAASADAKVLNEVRQFIQENFVREVSPELLGKDSVEDLVNGLDDPYSVYFNPEEYVEFQQSTDQTFGGVGMQVEQRGDYVTVVAPLKNTPAFRAGIKSGDKVIAVNEENVVGKPQDYVVRLIRGEPGTTVVLTIEREGLDENLIFSITREIIQLEVVESKMLDDKIGYVRLSTFSLRAGSEFSNAVAALKGKGMEALVFDLRHNPGGYLNAGLDIASDFAAKGDILLHVVGRDGIKDSYQSLSAALHMPTMVLVDGGSASAAEIVAGAIQDLGAGKLVGTQTFGKASVQTVFKLSNGGALKITTAKYLTPKEREIDGVGLAPDYVVEGEEAQLDKAVELLKEELAAWQPAAASLQVTLALNKRQAKVGEQEVALEASPYLAKGRTMVPLRFLAEALGGKVEWDKNKQAAVVTLGGKTILLTPGKAAASVDGKEVKLEVPAALVQGRTFVPIRFVAETLGAQVQFDQKTQEIHIIMSGDTPL